MTFLLSRLLWAVVAFCTVFLAPLPAAHAEEKVFIPGYWDLRRRPEKPDTSRLRQIRFLTESDYPPFHFIGADGMLAGFEVELARALCEALGVVCTIQPYRWDKLGDALSANQGDAIIAAYRITPEARQTFLFTGAYHRTPARFVTARTGGLRDASVEALKDRKVGVVAGSAHAAYLKAFFPAVRIEPQSDTASVLNAVRYGGVDAGFVDGATAAFWLNGDASAGCCRFLGGPYTESRFFGEGVGIALRKDAVLLRDALDWALHRVASDGTYATLYLKYFPVGFY